MNATGILRGTAALFSNPRKDEVQLRPTYLTSFHMARCDGSASLRIVALDHEDVPELVLELVPGRTSAEAPGLGPDGYDLMIGRAGKPAVQVEHFQLRAAGEAAFKRHAVAILGEYKMLQADAAPTIEPAPAVEAPRGVGRLRRVARGLLPWFGGAGLTILAAFVISGSNGGQQVAAEVPVPQAFNQLPADQQKLLLQFADRAAQQYMADPASQMGAAAAAANGATPVGQVGYGMPPGAQGAPAGLAAVVAQMQAGAVPPGLTSRKLVADEIRELKHAPQMVVAKGKNVVYAFEDPACSSCQEFARNSRTLGEEFQITVLPVGFQKGGREQAAAALCSKDPVQAWGQVMRNLPVDGVACEAGLRQVDANNELFRKLGFDGTPTIVATNGVTLRGSADAATLASWMKTNAR